MRSHTHRRGLVTTAGAAALALILAACGGADDLGGGDSSSSEGDATSADCSEFEEYGTFDGGTVTIASSIRETEADQLQQTFDDFEKCTGLKVEHNGIGEFENQIVVQAEGGNAPDLAIFPQPGLLKRMVDSGYIKEAPSEVEAKVDEGWNEDWKSYGTVDGTFYAAPLMASVKSFVWYSPTMFEDAGVEVPATWQELVDVTETLAKNNSEGTTRPWCAGIESGGATGWPATDWIEDLVLRVGGGDVYDQWVTHEIPFNDAKIKESAEYVGEILTNDEYVNGGIGDARSVASTSFNDGGLPILDNECYMHRQASFYEAQWPEGTTVAEDGDVFAFPLPPVTEGEVPLLVAGEFVGAFNDNPETKAVQAYMASGTWANTRVEIGGVTSANHAVDASKASSPILKQAIELLQDESAIVRFDGSDMMPSEVGAGSFWKGMTQWLNKEKDLDTVLSEIEASWPAQ
ncbi:MAG: ABC transporter substrate-binding protein [Bowdeniella nasicola]|nr:ABC transporter substrate-binding protein [Bowdeniella nasicola]